MKILGMVSCTQCELHSKSGCNSSDTDVQLNYNRFGNSSARECPQFRLEKVTKKQIGLEDALKFMLNGRQEFIMISGITGRRLRYLIEKKITPADKTGKSAEVFWVHCEGKSGILEYAGTIYEDTQSKEYRFSQGSRGKFKPKSLQITSLLYVLNNLAKHKYDMPLQIENPNEFEKRRQVETV